MSIAEAPEVNDPSIPRPSLKHTSYDDDSTQLLTPRSSKQSSPSPSTALSPRKMAPPFVAIRPEDSEHIWIVTGPAGCGKTTVASYLSWQLALPYLEGDDYHPKCNKDKMASGHPLNDADRWDWLITLREEAVSKITTPKSAVSSHNTSGSSSSSNPTPPTSNTNTDTNNSSTITPSLRGVIITCSALKRKYRDVIRIASYNHPRIQVHFIYLRATESMLLERVAARQGHYMKSNMVHSQFEHLEEPIVKDDPDPERRQRILDAYASANANANANASSTSPTRNPKGRVGEETEDDVLIIDVNVPPEVVQQKALEAVKAKLSEYSGGIIAQGQK